MNGGNSGGKVESIAIFRAISRSEVVDLFIRGNGLQLRRVLAALVNILP